MDLVSAELPARTLVVGIDPGKATNRVLLATGEKGMLGEPASLPAQREGVDHLCALIAEVDAPQTVIAIEATGSLRLSWAAELERRLPGSRRFKDDDRDCAALVSLARQGRGRTAQVGTLDALLVPDGTHAITLITGEAQTTVRTPRGEFAAHDHVYSPPTRVVLR